MRWELITEDEYYKCFRQEDEKAMLHVVKTFTDPEGTMPFGNLKPRAETIWGRGETEMFMTIMSKESWHSEKWNYQYFRNTHTTRSINKQ